ncbi:MAG TPA: hypothetical protein V6D22_13755 [Candidatus Obscuribacterales bacterium]
MATKVKSDFITAEGLLNFSLLHPGQAKDGQRAGSKAYTLELSLDPLVDAFTANNSIIDAVSRVAQANAPNPNLWQSFVFGPTGILRKLEEMPGRNPSLYGYAHGKYVLSMSKTLSLKSLKMEGADLTNPTVRAEYDRKVAEAAPKVVRFTDPANSADAQRVQEENVKRVARGETLLDASQRVLIPCHPSEIWDGCTVRVFGHCYWEGNIHKKVLLSFDQVLLVRQGPRLVPEASPDAVFGSFAPPSDLAPPPAGQPDPWKIAI